MLKRDEHVNDYALKKKKKGNESFSDLFVSVAIFRVFCIRYRGCAIELREMDFK